MKKASMRHETTNYEQMGIAALLPGLIFAGELIQARIHELQDQLAGIMTNGAAPRRGRPPKSETAAANGKIWGGWPDDPEERRAEQMRRRQVARDKRLAEESHAKRVAAGAKRWTGMTAKQKKEHLAKMAAGRKNRGSANPNHPGNPNHPDHAAFVARMTAARKVRANRERAAA